MQAENTHQVFDWLWTSGQLSKSDIAELPALGVEAVINLALPTSNPALPGEAELVTGAGLNYFQIPVLWEQPELRQLAQFFSLIDAMKEQRVWVHCAKNMRVSAFVYLYRRVRLGETHSTAAFPLREVWEPNEIWQSFIASALQAHAHASMKTIKN